MRLAFLALLLAGCDAVGDAAPAWVQAGAVATFDYQPGPDSLSVLGPGRAAPFRRAPSATRTVVMRVSGDATVEWADADTPGLESRFAYEARLPLVGEAFAVSGDGLTRTVAQDCPDWLSRTSSAASPLTFVRVPRAPVGDFDVWTDCARSPLRYRAARTETVTVPGGTFDAVVIETPHGVEWWSWSAGLVRYDVIRYDGVLQGRFERSADA